MRTVMASLLVAAVLTGCSDTDRLCAPCGCDEPEPEGQRVAYDWSLDPEAQPEGMRLWFYPLDWAGQAMPVDLPGRDGGEILVTPGRYALLAHNNDNEWVLHSGTDTYGGHTVSTGDAGLFDPLFGGMRTRTAARADETDGERVAACPEPTWGASSDETDVRSDSRITLRPTPLHCTYTYTFEDVGPLEHVANASASISGMAASVDLSTLSRTGETCTHPLSAEIDRTDDDIKGHFYTFGVTGDKDVRNRMALYVVMDDGTGYKFTQGDNLDVTAQIDAAPDPRHVNLVIRGVRIPDEGGSPSDFNVKVDDWGDDVVQDIPL